MLGRLTPVFSALLATSACVNDPLDVPCPDLAADDLVVTEIHGPQSGEDAYGEWIEVYNPTTREIDLRGLSVSLIRLDGSKQADLIVRTPVPLVSGGYAVFGRQLAGQEPAHVDYGYISDFDSKLYDSAAVEISSCGRRVDVAVYRNLPPKGSLILDGATEPDAELNNDEANWCVDAREDENSETDGIRGTPKEANPVCEE